MKLRHLVCASALLFSPTLAPTAFGSERVIKKLNTMYTAAEAHLQTKFPSYKLITRVRKFDERLNASSVHPIKTNPPKAIAALHDLNTGEPLESCRTPCNLHLDVNRTYLLALFKTGHVVQTREISMANYNPASKPYILGFNVVGAEYAGRKCLRDFAQSEKIDGEAKPCMRVPALMPHQAETSGYCIMNFDLTARGLTENIRVKSCSDPVFGFNSEAAVQWWVYTPTVERGVAVPTRDMQTRITYNLRGPDGELVPR